MPKHVDFNEEEGGESLFEVTFFQGHAFRDGGPYLKYLNREDAAHLMSLTFS